MSVDCFQLDNQMLETLRPVVLSPTDVTSGANRLGRRCLCVVCTCLHVCVGVCVVSVLAVLGACVFACVLACAASHRCHDQDDQDEQKVYSNMLAIPEACVFMCVCAYVCKWQCVMYWSLAKPTMIVAFFEPAL
jgi:hypothetical protein